MDAGDLIPDHNLSVTRVWTDEYGLRIGYEIVPPLEHAGGPSPFFWLADATEENGTRHEDGQGAFGLAPDGSRTEGVLTISWPPPRAPGKVRVRFTPWGDVESLDEVRTFELLVALAP